MKNSSENTQNNAQNHAASERKCEIDGKRFILIRHFTGDRPLSGIVTEIAINRAKKEMGL